ncbi:hypothetical protein ACOSQ4_005547 [Xanthoceras sorbifolium]
MHGCSLPSFVKVTTDAPVDSVGNRIGLSVVIRDHIGKVLSSGVKCLDFLISPMIAKVVAVLFSIIVALEGGFTSPTIETDASNVVKLVLYEIQSLFEIEHVIGYIIKSLVFSLHYWQSPLTTNSDIPQTLTAENISQPHFTSPLKSLAATHPFFKPHSYMSPPYNHISRRIAPSRDWKLLTR